MKRRKYKRREVDAGSMWWRRKQKKCADGGGREQ